MTSFFAKFYIILVNVILLDIITILGFVWPHQYLSQFGFVLSTFLWPFLWCLIYKIEKALFEALDEVDDTDNNDDDYNQRLQAMKNLQDQMENDPEG